MWEGLPFSLPFVEYSFYIEKKQQHTSRSVSGDLF